jgi:hypothetical protein
MRGDKGFHMTQLDKLSLEEVEKQLKWRLETASPHADVYQQLADTMRERDFWIEKHAEAVGALRQSNKQSEKPQLSKQHNEFSDNPAKTAKECFDEPFALETNLPLYLHGKISTTLSDGELQMTYESKTSEGVVGVPQAAPMYVCVTGLSKKDCE